jgi:hypothetical protein
MHGAAYAVAIETVGGSNAIASCSEYTTYMKLKAKLISLDTWAMNQPSIDVRKAYRWGIDRVDADMKGRLEIYENSRSVRDALATLPRPEKVDG